MLFGLLGPVVIRGADENDNTRIQEQLSEHRVRGVLAALLLRPNQDVPIATLINLLWDDPPPSALSNLRTYIARLRKALRIADPEKVRLSSSKRGADGTGSGSYRLGVASLEVDADVFIRLVTRAHQKSKAGRLDQAYQMLRQALSLWRGTAGGPDIAASRRLAAQLHAFNDLRVAAQEDLVEIRLRNGEHRVLIPQIRALLADHPCREVTWGQLMRAYYLGGDIAGALHAYHEARSTLQEELGVEPGSTLRSIHQAILNRDDDRIWLSSTAFLHGVDEVTRIISPYMDLPDRSASSAFEPERHGLS